MAVKKPNVIKKILEDPSIEEYVNIFPNKVGSKGFDAWGFNIKNMKNNMQNMQKKCKIGQEICIICKRICRICNIPCRIFHKICCI